MKFNIQLFLTGLFLFVGILFYPIQQEAQAKYTPTENELVSRMVNEVLALDENIISVRASRIKEPSLPKFQIQWMPTLTLKKGVPIEVQENIARKISGYVVDFQQGVRSKNVRGGIIAFFEGKGWYPEIKVIKYKIKSRPVGIEVWTYLRRKEKGQENSCCDDGSKIGIIKGNNFISF